VATEAGAFKNRLDVARKIHLNVRGRRQFARINFSRSQLKAEEGGQKAEDRAWRVLRDA
jgi:hypothetical protein